MLNSFKLLSARTMLLSAGNQPNYNTDELKEFHQNNDKPLSDDQKVSNAKFIFPILAKVDPKPIQSTETS